MADLETIRAVASSVMMELEEDAHLLDITANRMVGVQANCSNVAQSIRLKAKELRKVLYGPE